MRACTPRPSGRRPPCPELARVRTPTSTVAKRADSSGAPASATGASAQAQRSRGGGGAPPGAAAAAAAAAPAGHTRPPAPCSATQSSASARVSAAPPSAAPGAAALSLTATPQGRPPRASGLLPRAGVQAGRGQVWRRRMARRQTSGEWLRLEQHLWHAGVPGAPRPYCTSRAGASPAPFLQDAQARLQASAQPGGGAAAAPAALAHERPPAIALGPLLQSPPCQTFAERPAYARPACAPGAANPPGDIGIG